MPVSSTVHQPKGNIILLLRMARLFRILRLARLIHSLPPLYNLVLGDLVTISVVRVASCSHSPAS